MEKIGISCCFYETDFDGIFPVKSQQAERPLSAG